MPSDAYLKEREEIIEELAHHYIHVRTADEDARMNVHAMERLIFARERELALRERGLR